MGLSLLVYHDDLNQLEFVAEVLSTVLGYESTQAMNCASIIAIQGQYVVKRMKRSQLKRAELLVENLASNGIYSKLLGI